MFTAVILAATLIASLLKKRKQILECITLLAHQIKIEVRYSHLSVVQMVDNFSSIKPFSSLNFLKECNESINNGNDFPVSWKKAVENESVLNSAEKEKLIALGNSLGTTDSSSQMDILDIYILYFETFSKEAASTFEKAGRSIIYTGFLIGLGLFILIV